VCISAFLIVRRFAAIVKTCFSVLYTIGLFLLIAATQMTKVSDSYAWFISFFVIAYFTFELTEGRLLMKILQMLDSNDGRVFLSESITPNSSVKGKEENLVISHKFHRSIIFCSFATVIKSWAFNLALLFILLGSLHTNLDIG